MDFLNGGELFYHLRKDQKFSERRACFYAAQLVEALRCLHMNGVIYRDLKPENLLLDAEGYVKVVGKSFTFTILIDVGVECVISSTIEY